MKGTCRSFEDESNGGVKGLSGGVTQGCLSDLAKEEFRLDERQQRSKKLFSSLDCSANEVKQRRALLVEQRRGLLSVSQTSVPYKFMAVYP